MYVYILCIHVMYTYYVYIICVYINSACTMYMLHVYIYIYIEIYVIAAYPINKLTAPMLDKKTETGAPQSTSFPRHPRPLSSSNRSTAPLDLLPLRLRHGRIFIGNSMENRRLYGIYA